MKNYRFSEQMLRWYKRHARDLPWRRTSDPYKIWISEIMLQQTTVTAVISYYKRWIKEFPNVKSVAKSSSTKILKMWQGLGYYSRARNIQKAAKIIISEHGGKIPSTTQDLKSLPGFGPYTTGAVLSIAFDQREPIIDANVRRVVMRLMAIKGKADGKNDKAILKFLLRVMPKKNNNIFNQSLMELGALICRSKKPLCSQCPIRKGCQAYKKGIQEIIPMPKNQKIKDIETSIAVIKRGPKYLIQKRPSQGLLADMWEFPGGKIEKGETARVALNREVEEELGQRVKSAKFLMNVNHYYTTFKVRLHVWSCSLEKYPSTNRVRKWVSPKDLEKYPMPSGSVKIVDALLKK